MAELTYEEYNEELRKLFENMPQQAANPSGLSNLTPEQMGAHLEELYRWLYPEVPEDWGDIVPKSPAQMTGSAPTAPPSSPTPQPPLPASHIPTQVAQGLPGPIASQGASAAVYGTQAANPGIWSRLRDFATDPRRIMETAGAATGALSQSSASNRGAQLAAGMDLERLLLDRDDTYFNQRIRREQEGRTGASDAWRKLVATDYAQNRGPQPQLSPYSVGSRDLSGLQPGAQALSAEAMQRLQGGNPIAPVTERPLAVDPNLMKPGALEKISGYVSPWLTLFGRV